MAAFEDIEKLRHFVAEPEPSEPWTDTKLGAIIDAYEGNVRAAAAHVWTAKAASAAHLVNISEGGSSRQMSDIHKNALAMASAFSASAGDEVIGGVSTRAARTRAIERP